MERDRYLLLFEEQYLSRFVDQKFDILDTIHQVVNSSGLAATLSIGIGKDGGSFQELMQYANLSIEMALSRGGDQAVIRNKFTFEFYGGRSNETEKRTKVKSRVMANALSALMSDSSKLFIMGHKMPDMDATGAAAGVCAIARKKGVPAYIIREAGTNPSKPILDKLDQLPEYQGEFPQCPGGPGGGGQPLPGGGGGHQPPGAGRKPRSCWSPATGWRSSTTTGGRPPISKDAALNYHEPYASSACELVTELLQYIAEPTDLLRTEAEALLAGIVLDTKNFTMRTGGRTFEAAAFLRRSGADTGEVKRLFQNDLSGTIAKYDIIQNAKLYRDHIAIAVVDHTRGPGDSGPGGGRAAEHRGDQHLLCALSRRGADHHLRPLHGRHQRPGHPGAAGGRRQRRRRRRTGGGQDAGTGGRGADTGHRPLSGGGLLREPLIPK